MHRSWQPKTSGRRETRMRETGPIPSDSIPSPLGKPTSARRASPPPSLGVGHQTSDELSDSFETDEPPRLLTERYEILQWIETGGMGIIYKAFDRLLNREVAVKVLRRDRATKDYVDDFANEARIMSFLSHPGVAPIYETGVCANGQPYHVMKLVGGITLQTMLQDQRIEKAELLQIFTDVCQTMAFAHSRGVIHLDLKPANVMVGEFGEVNVMDWGLAQHFHRGVLDPSSSESQPHVNGAPSLSAELEASELITRQAHINGTPEYMSPEQARGGTLDSRADVFSLGGILCEILSGHAPYEGDSLQQVYRCAVRGKTFLSLERLLNCGFDDAIVRLAINCLQVDINKRPVDAMVLSQVMTAHQASTLRSVRSDMNRFFELSPDMFCIADHNGFFVRINDNFSRVLGHSNEALLSNPFLSFVHEDDRERTIAQVSALREGRPVVRFRNRYITANGDYIAIEWTAKSIEGEHLIYAVARDVSAQVT
ncbi:protein kinase domain-containing protein [Rhodopirellula sp. SWK7]|uniref:protein kinase domain-containing protein n=1 Tax=Rhodopirellula sp. SWK7 TaxID=595460 RepID=UPI0002BDB74E|nr:protein kinase [Rhodopirellula sp. SWK7]EMI44705.1 serine/threonine-protein kinase pknB [Rhodopirellula sp. SWK7]